jgi:hypothetical protein
MPQRLLRASLFIDVVNTDSEVVGMLQRVRGNELAQGCGDFKEGAGSESEGMNWKVREGK